MLTAIHDTLGSLHEGFRFRTWTAFLETTGMLGADMVSGVAARECFLKSRTPFLDEENDGAPVLPFTGFLEAICRAVDGAAVPAAGALRQAKAASATDFYERCSALLDAGDAISATELLGWVEDPSSPLGSKLELMLPYLLQNLAVSSRGELGAASKVNLKQYLTAAQRETWLATDAAPQIRRSSLLGRDEGFDADVRAVQQRRCSARPAFSALDQLKQLQADKATTARGDDVAAASAALGAVNLVRLYGVQTSALTIRQQR